MKRIIFIFTLMVMLLLAGVTGYSASFDAYTEIQDKGSLGFAPTFKLPTTFDSVEVELWFSYGILENLDLQLNASTLGFGSEGFQWGGVYILPRYNIGELSILEYNIFGLGLGYGDGFSLDIHYHTQVGILRDILSLEINLVGTLIPSLSASGVFALVVHLTEWLALYVEVNPEVSFGEGSFGVGGEVRPGIDIDLGNYGELNISYSISQEEINFSDPTSQEIGVFYSISIF